MKEKFLVTLLLASCLKPELNNPEAGKHDLDEPQTHSCPEEMANIDDLFCIDKYEASIIDKKTLGYASPHYIPSQELVYDADWQYEKFKSLGNLPMPERGAEQYPKFEPFAVSVSGKIPVTYANRFIAEKACHNAGKRLCMHQEWYKACVGPKGPKAVKNSRGEFPRAYPYGSQYQPGKCNVGLQNCWPPEILGRKNNWEMKDPRIGALLGKEGLPMKRATGSFPECTNGYGVYDMVGNAHEIVFDFRKQKYLTKATFAGSHYARNATESCAEVTPDHGDFYNDYSIGFRCCKNIQTPKPEIVYDGEFI